MLSGASSGQVMEVFDVFAVGSSFSQVSLNLFERIRLLLGTAWELLGNCDLDVQIFPSHPPVAPRKKRQIKLDGEVPFSASMRRMSWLTSAGGYGYSPPKIIWQNQGF